MLSAMFRRRWVRWLVGIVVVVLAGSVIYFQTVVAPQLTARRFEVQVAGEDSRLVVEVDEDAPLIAMTGGVNGLSDIVATGESLFVLASDVGAQSDATWVVVPMADLGPLPAVLTASRLSHELSIGVKDCRRLQGDAEELVSMMLRTGESAPEAELCGAAIRNIASAGTVTVDMADLRPSDLTAPPTDSVVALAEVANSDHVLAELERLLPDA